MNIDVNAALRQVVADVGCDAGLLVDLSGEHDAEVIATTVDGRSRNGERWPAGAALRLAGQTPRLLHSPADLTGVLPTSVRLASSEPVRGVTIVPIDGSTARLLFLWRATSPPPVDQQQLSATVELFKLLAPLLEAHVRARTRAAHLTNVVEALEQAVVVVNGEAGTAMVNSAGARLLGVPADTTSARVVSDAMRALRLRSSDPDGLERRSAALMSDPASVISGWLWTFHQPPTHLHVHSSPIDGPFGSGRVWVFDDVSREMHLVAREQEARAALAESELRYRMIVERASDVVFQNVDGVLQWISQNSLNTVGWSPEELVGRTTEHLWHPDDLEEAKRIRDATYHGGSGRGVLRLRHKSGRYMYMDVSLQPYQDDVTGRSGAVGYMHDITERVLAEMKLAESESEARQLAAEYARASQEAEQANEAKTSFLSRMSHELRTPLNAVIGFAQLLELDTLTPQQSAAVRHIRSGGQHLLNLINEILDISRIEAGRIALSLEPLNAMDLMKAALDLVRPTAESLSIELEGPLGPADETTVRGDRQRVVQVLLNLLTNAVKYNRWHGSVTFTCEPLQDGTVAFRVTDTGHGITEENLARLFQPFDRLGLESSTIEGTGIGLTLSKALAAAMGGTIEVTSREEIGSTFSLVLPATEPAARTPVPVSLRLPHDGRRVDVLYIEDNPQNAALMRGIVARRPGTRLRVAMDGATGLRIATEEPPDLVMLDLQLPDIAGEEVLRTLRTHPATANVPVVILTADATPGLRERLLGLGADAFLTKPVDVRQVLQLLASPPAH